MTDIDGQCRIEREEVQGYFNQYWRHSSVLRNWFVAYGIGALVLVIHKNGAFFATSNQKRLFVLFIKRNQPQIKVCPLHIRTLGQHVISELFRFVKFLT